MSLPLISTQEDSTATALRQRVLQEQTGCPRCSNPFVYREADRSTFRCAQCLLVFYNDEVVALGPFPSDNDPED